MKTGLASSLSIAALLLAATPLVAAGPNLLRNPTFNTDATWWTGVLSTWNATDANGAPGSGSLRTIYPPGNPDEIANLQCVQAAPGPYVQRASVFVNGTPDDYAFITTAFYAATDCSGPILDQILETGVGLPNGSWTQLGTTGDAPVGTRSAYVAIGLQRGHDTSGTLAVYWDDLYFGTGACADGPQNLCVNQERFKITAHYTAGSQEGFGTAVPFADESGSFWFFAPTNIELDAKVLNACALDGHYWFFAAGLTNVKVDIQVTDTKTGATKAYHNAANHVFSTITDTSAFATCP